MHAVVGSPTPNTGTVTVNLGTATQLTLSGLTSQTAGSAESLTVSARTPRAHRPWLLGHGGVQLERPAASLPANYTFVAGDEGVSPDCLSPCGPGACSGSRHRHGAPQSAAGERASK